MVPLWARSGWDHRTYLPKGIWSSAPFFVSARTNKIHHHQPDRYCQRQTGVSAYTRFPAHVQSLDSINHNHHQRFNYQVPRFKFLCQRIGVTATQVLTCPPALSRHHARMIQGILGGGGVASSSHIHTIFFSPVQTGLPREPAESFTRAAQPGLVSPGGSDQAQRCHPASLSSDYGESLRHKDAILSNRP
jgi:hypothetical protein